MTAGPYAIGSDLWPGLSKLAEEAGEVAQVIGKIIGANGAVDHWDGGPPLNLRLEDEMADLMAAMIFVAHKNGCDLERMVDRSAAKLTLFEQWHIEHGAGA
jgi:NTP pyrophosphatase (non-canonical NTP hydrolase)